MQDSTQLRPNGPVRLFARSLEQSAMAWARRGGEVRAIPATATPTRHTCIETLHDGVRPLRFLSFNIQVGIGTARYRHYFTKGWKHVLPHPDRHVNLE